MTTLNKFGLIYIKIGSSEYSVWTITLINSDVLQMFYVIETLSDTEWVWNYNSGVVGVVIYKKLSLTIVLLIEMSDFLYLNATSYCQIHVGCSSYTSWSKRFQVITRLARTASLQHLETNQPSQRQPWIFRTQKILKCCVF